MNLVDEIVQYAIASTVKIQEQEKEIQLLKSEIATLKQQINITTKE